MKDKKDNFIDDISNKINDKFEELVKNLDSKETQDEIKAYLDAATLFHNYSINNQILIGEQAYNRGMQVEEIASYKKWSELKNEAGEKTNVKKGEKGLIVIVPIEYKLYQTGSDGKHLTDDKGNKIPLKNKNGNDKKGLGFKKGTVFDVNQTNAKEIGAYKTLEYRQKGDDKQKVYEELSHQIVEKYKLKIIEEKISDGSKGSYNYKDEVIKIKEDMTTNEKISTLYHELGHHILHSKELKEDSNNYKDMHINRGAREGEAEAFSYIMSSMQGIDNKSELYIKTWGNTGKDLKERFTKITKATKDAAKTLNLEYHLNKQNTISKTDEIRKRIQEKNKSNKNKENNNRR